MCLAMGGVLAVAGPAVAQTAPHPLWSSVPPPHCDGTDKAAAEHQKSEGIAHYRRAKAGQGDVATEFTTALASFDAACAAGDDTALELRGYALAGLERWVEALESLDAFLAAHPLLTLSDDIKGRVSAQLDELSTRTATLNVDTKPQHGVRVLVIHREMGATPI